MRITVIVVAAGAAAMLWTGVGAQQEMLSRPGPGSGITRVEGSVNIANTPPVRAMQEGEWRVAIAPVTFFRPKGRYLVTWPDGSIDRMTIAETGQGDWVLTEGASRRWLNLSMARSVEELR